MSASSLKTFAAAALLTTFGVALVNASTPDKTLKDMAGYRQWTRVTEKPIPVESPSFAG